jgi:Protein of unknown function (DUF4127)
MRALARCVAAVGVAWGIALAGTSARADSGRPVVFVPLDDRPVTYQLPQMLGAIAGRPIVTPPRATLGHYLAPGDPEAILSWLESGVVASGSTVVASLDMIAYGGLVASRVPGEAPYVAYARLRRLAALRETSRARMFAFGTIMRLAPTGVPRAPQTADYWATGDTVDEIAAYANLPWPNLNADQIAKAQRLRDRIGAQRLDAYLGARLRNLSVDQIALQFVAEGGIDELVLGQDDAGPAGLHVADIAALRTTARRFALDARAAVEPGADELGMVLVARAFARELNWRPRVRVRYSRAGAGDVVDPLEFVPIDVTIGRLIEASGGARSDAAADVDLFVRVGGTSDSDERAFVDAIAADVAARIPVAVADLTFLAGPMPNPEQRALTEELIARGLAGRIDAFASWNTDANTVGTALAAAVAAESGRRAGTFDARAHAQFMLDRYADDYAFHQFVRPALNEALRTQGIDTTLLFPPTLQETDDANRALLWPRALALLRSIYPDERDAGLTIMLPWQRTFETELDVRLEPHA